MKAVLIFAAVLGLFGSISHAKDVAQGGLYSCVGVDSNKIRHVLQMDISDDENGDGVANFVENEAQWSVPRGEVRLKQLGTPSEGGPTHFELKIVGDRTVYNCMK